MLRRKRPEPAPEPVPESLLPDEPVQLDWDADSSDETARNPADYEPRPSRVRVHVADEDSGEEIDLETWRAYAGSVFQAEGVVGPGESTLLFVSSDAMALLNKIHMGHDGPTDVLSFPIDGDDHIMGVDVRLVGDIVICPAVARANAATHAGTFENELALLITHGVLHLLGHDHAEREERDRMWEREKALLGEFWGDLPAGAWKQDE